MKRYQVRELLYSILIAITSYFLVMLILGRHIANIYNLLLIILALIGGISLRLLDKEKTKKQYKKATQESDERYLFRKRKTLQIYNSIVVFLIFIGLLIANFYTVTSISIQFISILLALYLFFILIIISILKKI